MTARASTDELPRVVFVDDDGDLLAGLRDRLRHLRDQWDMRFCASASAAMEELSAARSMVVVTDWMMPGMDGMSLCSHITHTRAAAGLSRCYVIVLSGRGDIDSSVEALELGADDFLAKPCDTRALVARVKVGIRVGRLEDELRQTTARLELLATTDPLTGLRNRRSALETLANELDRTQRGQQDLSVAVADIDYFKQVNDSHGHAAGDSVLTELAGRLKLATRRYDVLVRWGGEEFLIICPHAGRREAATVAERIRRLVEQEPVRIGPDCALTVTLSIGTATVPSGINTTADAAIATADAALYRAKEAGRNRVFDGGFVGSGSPVIIRAKGRS